MSPPEQFGRYRLLRRLPHSHSEVYEADDTASGQRVALTLFADHSTTNLPAVRRVDLEAQTLRRLLQPIGEPHLLLLEEVGQIDGRPYLRTPLVDATDLQTLLDREGPLSPSRAVHIVEQIAAALDVVHAAQVVCRDVAPRQILVGPNDFAYLYCQPNLDDFPTEISEPQFTPYRFGYLSPQRLQTGDVGVADDCYALTCVLYECLTGAPPYTGTIEERIFGHLHKHPPQPSYANATLTPFFDGVVGRGMDKDVQLRYPSAGALAEAARAGLGPGAPPPARRRGSRLSGLLRRKRPF